MLFLPPPAQCKHGIAQWAASVKMFVTTREELWLARAPGGGKSGGGGSRLPTDENKLIAKKFKSRPSTQAEVRDCAAELAPADIGSIVASHKEIHFGRVCVNSVTAKNFTVTNDLQRAVLVSLGRLEPELSKSGPGAQVLPAGATAGFDIVFQSASECHFKKQVQYIVNERHTFKCTVTAEVVPIEVKLSTLELKMAFPDDSLDIATSETISLTNPGNASAEFFWAARGPFAVTPEQGKLEPFSSCDVLVTWQPTATQKNLAKLALHVPGGEDQELSVVGELPEVSAKPPT